MPERTRGWPEVEKDEQWSRAAELSAGAALRVAGGVSSAQSEASRRNGAKSRGPRTPEGKGVTFLCATGKYDELVSARPVSPMSWRRYSPTELESNAAVVHVGATAGKFIRLKVGPLVTSHPSHSTVLHARAPLPARRRIPTLTREAF